MNAVSGCRNKKREKEEKVFDALIVIDRTTGNVVIISIINININSINNKDDEYRKYKKIEMVLAMAQMAEEKHWMYYWQQIQQYKMILVNKMTNCIIQSSMTTTKSGESKMA